MDFAAIAKALKKIHIQEGRNAADAGIDRGLNPHMIEPDKSNWEYGYDTRVRLNWIIKGSTVLIVED